MTNETVSDWRVASYTGGQGNCVEVGRSATTTIVCIAAQRRTTRLVVPAAEADSRELTRKSAFASLCIEEASAHQVSADSVSSRRPSEPCEATDARLTSGLGR